MGKSQPEECPPIAFPGEKDRVLVEPITDQFIVSLQGVLATHGLPRRIVKSIDRDLR
jgi:hypothetical protein